MSCTARAVDGVRFSNLLIHLVLVMSKDGTEGEWIVEETERDESPQRAPFAKEPLTTAAQRKSIKRSLFRDKEQEFSIPQKQTKSAEESPEKKDWLKYVKVKPFPQNIPQPQKWQAWLDYRRKLSIQLEQCGNATQKAMAGLVYTSIGEEMEQIISAREMFPDGDDLPDDYPYLTKMIGDLDEYFKGLSDEAVNFNEFSNMKQKLGEAARDFHTRVVRQAEVCGIKQSQSMIRNTFIQGMRDREQAKRAFTDAIPIEEVISAATRRESLQHHESPIVILDGDDPKKMIEVDAISNRFERRSKPAGRGKTEQQGKGQQWQPRKHSGSRPCPNCGIDVHRTGVCPARDKECRECHKKGHFARVCRAKQPIVAAVKAEETDQSDKVDLYE